MREVYRGNGFVITTNDSGEIFVTLETHPNLDLRLTSKSESMLVSYQNTRIEMVPIGYKILSFRV